MSNAQLFAQLKEYIKRDEGVALAVVVRGLEGLLGAKALIPAAGEAVGPLLAQPWAGAMVGDARQLMAERAGSTTRRYAAEVELFFDIHRPAPRLIIVGAVHIAESLIHYARPLGFKTYLVDPRTAFATRERFPHVDEMVHGWPDEALPEIGLNGETAVVVITHDPKLDDPALKVALPGPAFYVGALGSPNTHAQRIERLLAEGLSQAQLDRLHAPIGLEIGGRTPAEIGLSLMAEIVAIRNQSAP